MMLKKQTISKSGQLVQYPITKRRASKPQQDIKPYKSQKKPKYLKYLNPKDNNDIKRKTVNKVLPYQKYIHPAQQLISSTKYISQFDHLKCVQKKLVSEVDIEQQQSEKQNQFKDQSMNCIYEYINNKIDELKDSFAEVLSNRQNTHNENYLCFRKQMQQQQGKAIGKLDTLEESFCNFMKEQLNKNQMILNLQKIIKQLQSRIGTNQLQIKNTQVEIQHIDDKLGYRIEEIFNRNNQSIQQFKKHQILLVQQINTKYQIKQQQTQNTIESTVSTILSLKQDITTLNTQLNQKYLIFSQLQSKITQIQSIQTNYQKQFTTKQDFEVFEQDFLSSFKNTVDGYNSNFQHVQEQIEQIKQQMRQLSGISRLLVTTVNKVKTSLTTNNLVTSTSITQNQSDNIVQEDISEESENSEIQQKQEIGTYVDNMKNRIGSLSRQQLLKELERKAKMNN